MESAILSLLHDIQSHTNSILSFFHLLCVCVCVCVCVLFAQLCLTLCDSIDCSLPGSFVRVLQARILEWVAITFSRGSSQPRDRTWVSCIVGRFFTSEPPGKPPFFKVFRRKCLMLVKVNQCSKFPLYSQEKICRRNKFLLKSNVSFQGLVPTKLATVKEATC